MPRLKPFAVIALDFDDTLTIRDGLSVTRTVNTWTTIDLKPVNWPLIFTLMSSRPSHPEWQFMYQVISYGSRIPHYIKQGASDGKAGFFVISCMAINCLQMAAESVGMPLPLNTAYGILQPYIKYFNSGSEEAWIMAPLSKVEEVIGKTDYCLSNTIANITHQALIFFHQLCRRGFTAFETLDLPYPFVQEIFDANHDKIFYPHGKNLSLLFFYLTLMEQNEQAPRLEHLEHIFLLDDAAHNVDMVQSFFVSPRLSQGTAAAHAMPKFPTGMIFNAQDPYNSEQLDSLMFKLENLPLLVTKDEKFTYRNSYKADFIDCIRSLRKPFTEPWFNSISDIDYIQSLSKSSKKQLFDSISEAGPVERLTQCLIQWTLNYFSINSVKRLIGDPSHNAQHQFYFCYFMEQVLRHFKLQDTALYGVFSEVLTEDVLISQNPPVLISQQDNLMHEEEKSSFEKKPSLRI